MQNLNSIRAQRLRRPKHRCHGAAPAGKTHPLLLSLKHALRIEGFNPSEHLCVELLRHRLGIKMREVSAGDQQRITPRERLCQRLAQEADNRRIRLTHHEGQQAELVAQGALEERQLNLERVLRVTPQRGNADTSRLSQPITQHIDRFPVYRQPPKRGFVAAVICCQQLGSDGIVHR
jgi:hypothetical protein